MLSYSLALEIFSTTKKYLYPSLSRPSYWQEQDILLLCSNTVSMPRAAVCEVNDALGEKVHPSLMRPGSIDLNRSDTGLPLIRWPASLSC